MIKVIAVASLMLVCLDMISQQVVLSNPRRSKFYAGIYNPLEIMVEGYSCKSLVLTTDNGTLEKFSCHYNFVPAKSGLANINVKAKNGHTLKTIKAVTVYVDSLPSPYASLAGRRGGQTSKEVITVQPGIAASIEPVIGICLDYEVKKFTSLIIRKDSILFSIQNTGALFETKTKEMLKSLQTGDTVLFTNILCEMPDKSQRKIQPLEFYIL